MQEKFFVQCIENMIQAMGAGSVRSARSGVARDLLNITSTNSTEFEWTIRSIAVNAQAGMAIVSNRSPTRNLVLIFDFVNPLTTNDAKSSRKRAPPPHTLLSVSDQSPFDE